MTIWKYILPARQCTITVPRVDRWLSIQVQGSSVCVWALLDPAAPKREYDIRLFATGEDLPIDIGGYQFVGTVQLRDKTVWHCFAL